MPFLTLRALTAAALALCVLQAHAQARIYRCGNEYTNDPIVAKTKGCTVMEGGNITVVEGTKPTPARTPSPTTSVARSGNSSERVDAASQRARDSDARAILDAELRKAEERLAVARREYANGEPEKQGIESRNYQRYLDRVAELKAAVSRAEADVSGLQRELGRLPGSGPASANVSGSAAK